jgi:hypothetical protein
MAAKAPKRHVTFDKAGMLGFPSINEAVKYFSEPKNGGYSRRQISFLYGETFELNIGSLSLNMSYILKDKTSLDKLLGDQLKNPAKAKIIEKSIQEWIKVNSGGKDVAIPEKAVMKTEAPEAQTPTE